MNKIINKEIPFFDHCFDKNRLKKWIKKIYTETLLTEDLTILNFIETLKTLGFQEATKAGVSIGIEDLLIPPTKTKLLQQIEHEVQLTQYELTMNRLTALENFQNFIDTWHRTSETIKKEVVANFESTDKLNPVYMMAFSGARGNVSQVTQLVGMRGFMSDPEGQIIDYPIRSNFREGLTLTEYVISCYGARKGLVDTALRTADAGYLTRRLVDVAHSLVIVKFDCRTNQGIWLSEIQSDGKTVYSLQNRLIGRVLAQDIFIPFTDAETNEKKIIRWPYFRKNQQIDTKRASLLASCFQRVLIRSPLRCLKKKRLCQLCYGWTLPHAHLAPIGEAVGILAAQSIGEPGTQLTMRTFHTGGVFSGALSEDLKAPETGIIQYNKALQGALFRTSNGQIAFRTQEPGVLYIRSSQTIDQTLFQLDFPKGSVLFLKESQPVLKNQLLIELPKEQTIESETVLNTYTYYANRSGLLKLATNKIQLNTNNESKLVLHRKLPKFDKFYERASYIQPNFYSLRVYAGQISQSFDIGKILPKQGDLINEGSLLNTSQLIPNGTSSYLRLSNDQNSPSNYYIVQPFFQLPLFNTHYSYLYGYILEFQKQKSYYTITPKFNKNSFDINTELTIFNKNSYTLSSGILLKQNFVKKGRNSDFLSSEKTLDFPRNKTDFPTDFESLKVNKRQPILTTLFIPQVVSSDTGVLLKRKGRFSKTFKQIKSVSTGKLLSKRSEIQVTKPKSFKRFEWIRKETSLSSKINLQNKAQTVIANKSGFVVQSLLTHPSGFKWTKTWKQKSTNYYWFKQNTYKLKTGWPFISLNTQVFAKNHNEAQFYGSLGNFQVSFSDKVIFSQYIFYPVREKLVRVQDFKTKSIYLKRTNQSFESMKTQKFVLLFTAPKDYSFNQKSRKELELVFHPHQSFKLMQVFLKFSKKSHFPIINHWFQQFNKQTQTITTISTLKEQQSLAIQFSEYMKDVGSPPKRGVAVKWYSKPVNLKQILLNVSPNLTWQKGILTLMHTNPLRLTYDFHVSELLNSQNFLKNSPSLEFDKYVFTSKRFSELSSISANSPILESYFFSSYNGEVFFQKSEPDKVNSLILTNEDCCTFKSDFVTRKCRIGDILVYGTEMNPGQTPHLSGQVIQITKKGIKLQLVENSLVGSNSRFFCTNNQFIRKTSKIFTQSYPRLQMGDIVQGIPKIEEFFEARRTKEGVFFENNLHDRLTKRLNFYQTKCGYPFIIASRKSIYDLQKYLIDSIFKLYNSQGIDISDKHLEVIVRQMTSKVRITQFWSTNSTMPYKHPLPGEFYSRQYVEKYLRYRKNDDFDNVRYVPAILGITQAALENDGFISAASFQETTRILSQGAIFQKKDYLKGLKENVIVGHIIPAGTAVRTYTRRYKPPVMEQLWRRQGLQILSVNYQWKTNKISLTNSPIQYFNPIRLTILRILLFEAVQKL